MRIWRSNFQCYVVQSSFTSSFTHSEWWRATHYGILFTTWWLNSFMAYRYTYIYINHCKNSKLKLMDHSIENRRRGWFGSTIKTCIQKPNAMLMHRDVPCTPYILLVLRCQNAFCLICSKCTNSHLGISQSLNVLLYIYI